MAGVREDVGANRTAEVASLPFRVVKGQVPYLEYEADIGYGRQTFGPLFFGTPVFAAVTFTMEAFRALERSAAGLLAERDSLAVRVKELQSESERKDAKIAELERRLGRTKKAEA